jgi:hypothetical protein
MGPWGHGTHHVIGFKGNLKGIRASSGPTLDEGTGPAGTAGDASRACRIQQTPL